MMDGVGMASRAQTLDIVAVGEMVVNATTCREAFYRWLETPAEHRA